MAERISIKEGWESLKIIDEKMKETTKLMKKSAEKLNNYTLSNLTSDRDASLQFSSIIEEQKQINHNIMSNMDYVSDKIHLIQNSVIGDPNNFSQVGTILDRLTELEHSILPDPLKWPWLPILNIGPITTQEENFSSILLALLYKMVDYAKTHAYYKQTKFPLNSNIGYNHLRFERSYYNIRQYCNNAVGVVPAEFSRAVLSIASGLHYGLILTDCVEIGFTENIKLIKHTNVFDDLEADYSDLIEVVFATCPFEIKLGTKEFFLSLPFPRYHKESK